MIEKKETDGYLNLFLLHDENEDFSPRQWIRVSGSVNDIQLKSTIQVLIANVMESLDAGRTHVYRRIAEEIRIITGHEPSFSSIHAWVKGTHLPPLVFLKCLLEFHAKILGRKNGRKMTYVLPLLKEMSSGYWGSRVLVKIPNTLTTDLAYFLGIITGDGSLPNVKDKKGDRIYEIKLEEARPEFFERLYCPLILKLFGRQARLSKRMRQDGRVTWQAVIGAKPIFRLLTRLFDMPVGKKHDIVRMPTLIKNSNPRIWAFYIRGLFDTDGSISSGRVTLYSGSRSLMEDIGNCFRRLAIDFDLYEYKGRGAAEFQLHVSRDSTGKFIDLIGSNHPIKRERLMELAR